MNYILILAFFSVGLSISQAAEQSSPLPSTAEVNSIHSQLPPEVEQYNHLIAVISELTKRVDSLEHEVMSLKNGKPSFEGARTQAEAEATRKAAENAPNLVDSPAMAQYNQAFALLNQGELEKAKEAFLYITREYPDDIYSHKSWLHIGNIQLKIKNFGEAEKAFSEALTGKLETPLMIDARLGLAEANLKKEDVKACCDQLGIIQKEQLSPEQKKRFEAVKKSSSCQS